VDQEYLPDRIKKRIFYRPTNRGMEREIAKRIAMQQKKKG
jgi:replication-associated recombination protein RarA